MLNIATISLFYLLLLSPSMTITSSGEVAVENTDARLAAENAYREIYLDAGLEGKLDYGIYRRAVEGISAFNAPGQNILTIIDFTKPSSEERFFVIDLVNRKLLYQTLVAHGRNSGERECTRFSNRPSSLQSSPGFYLTAETYSGRHGYSLRLDGLEEGINDQARARAIVIHSADYVCHEYVEEYGYIGRSWGCPALPLDLNSQIIDLIKEGTCLYIHTNQTFYTSNSVLKNLPEQSVQLF